MASPLEDLINIGSYPLVPPSIYRATASLSFPLLNDSTWRSTIPQNLRLRYVREFLSTLGKRSQFHGQSNMCRSQWQERIDWALQRERIFFLTAPDLDEYKKRVKRSSENYQKESKRLHKEFYAGKNRVRTLTELAYMKMWEGASEEVKEKASAPSDDPVRLLILELNKKEEEAASEQLANVMKLSF